MKKIILILLISLILIQTVSAISIKSHFEVNQTENPITGQIFLSPEKNNPIILNIFKIIIFPFFRI